jgi:hypothetical protein
VVTKTCRENPDDDRRLVTIRTDLATMVCKDDAASAVGRSGSLAKYESESD